MIVYNDVQNTSVNGLNRNLIVPEVYAGIVREKIAGKVIVSQFAESDNTLQGQPGETLVFPAWRFIGVAQDHNPGTPMDTTKLKQKTAKATIKMVAAPGIEIEDADNLIAFGNQMNEGAAQQAISMAMKLDDDCIAELLTAPITSPLAKDGEVTFDEMIEAESLFGDDFNVEDVDGIIIHSKYKKSFIKMEGFVNKDLSYVDGNGAGIQRNNCIGSFMGVPVVVTDRMVNGEKHPIVILKKGALKTVTKEAPHVETARDASTRSTKVYCSDFYTVALVKEDAVVVLTA
jgi:hypothetical protein